ncbi:MAG: DUF4384 domain-containing protein [Candidatus Marinimicrobia bacterium]|nr:DUF4384 domain-containing protein [Candidatus Neomarinimicrobiota bacterium]
MKKITIFIVIMISIIIISCNTESVKDESNSKTQSNVEPKIIKQKVDNKIYNLGDNWYKVTAQTQIVNITPKEAEQKAINEARIKAIEYASGVEVNSSTLSIQSKSSFNSLEDYFSQINSLISRGFILEQEILSNITKTDNNILTQEITLKVKVGKQLGKKDPYFNLDAKLNKEHFTEGEKLQVTIKPSKDCYLTLLSVYSNETVGLLLPNQLKDNFAKENEVYQFPDTKDNFSIGVSLLPNKSKDSELIMVIASKQKINFSSFDKISSYNTLESSLRTIMQQLVKIPREEIETAFLQYHIYKK